MPHPAKTCARTEQFHTRRVSHTFGQVNCPADQLAQINSALLENEDDDDLTKAAKTALRAKFVALELPADFATHLQDDRQAITEAESEQEGDREEGVESTAAVGRLIKEGMKQSTYLDAIVRNKYARNPDKIRAWETASHLERAPQREKKPMTPSPTPPPTQ